jgi:hypothetical protein
MEKGEKIDLAKIVCRELNVIELVRLLKQDISVYWSWGAHALRNIENKGLRMKVNGHHHKGHVYIVLNGMDLFDVYYTTTKGTIVDSDIGIYFDMLVQAIDNRIERIPEYTK